MKFVLCFLAIVSCAAALPADVPFETLEELDLSKLVPNNIYLEPENPVDQSSLPAGRIIGGTEVVPNSIPHQVAVIINGNSFCGGTLISNLHVLTAAHCTINAATIELRFGAHFFNQVEPTQTRLTSTSVINHPNYGIGGFAANDVAVVFLPSALVFNQNIQYIPLADADSGDFAGSTATLSGWGRTSDASNAVSPVLNSVTLQIISNAACSAVFGNAILHSTICTSGTGSVGACSGDSGGPLVVDGRKVGVVSFGSAQCQAGNPTAYARVSSFRNWIRDTSGA